MTMTVRAAAGVLTRMVVRRQPMETVTRPTETVARPLRMIHGKLTISLLLFEVVCGRDGVSRFFGRHVISDD